MSCGRDFLAFTAPVVGQRDLRARGHPPREPQPGGDPRALPLAGREDLLEDEACDAMRGL